MRWKVLCVGVALACVAAGCGRSGAGPAAPTANESTSVANAPVDQPVEARSAHASTPRPRQSRHHDQANHDIRVETSHQLQNSQHSEDLFAAAPASDESAGLPVDPLSIFKQRIVPIMKAQNPSSCAECHLSGVDLKQYIRPSQEETFAAMRDMGLIDVDKPEASKILTFINRRPEKPSLVSDKIRKQEYDAFKAWIAVAVNDPELAAAKTDDAALGPDLPLEVVRHARQDRVLASFVDNVWSEVGRCAACHSPDRNQKQVQEHGAKVSWIKLRDPQATLDYMCDAGLIDTDNPEESLLLTKPTMQVKHGGGQKLMVGDRTYTQIRQFIEDYAATIEGKYRSADELPARAAEVSQVTDVWLKLTGVPAELDKQLLRVDVYRWDDAAQNWSTERWATGDRAIAGDRQLWQQHLTVTAPRGSKRADEIRNVAQLPPGRYLLKVYVDREGRTEKKYPYTLGEREFVDEVELRSNWKAGYGSMTIATFPQRGAANQP